MGIILGLATAGVEMLFDWGEEAGEHWLDVETRFKNPPTERTWVHTDPNGLHLGHGQCVTDGMGPIAIST